MWMCCRDGAESTADHCSIAVLEIQRADCQTHARRPLWHADNPRRCFCRGEGITALGAGADAPRPMLIGDAALCARYRHAATLFGWPPVDTIDGAAAAGLWVLAERAGLLAAASEGAAVRLDEPAAALGGRHDDRQAVDPVPDNACNISGDSR